MEFKKSIPQKDNFYYSLDEFKSFLDENKIKYKKKTNGFPDMRCKEINHIHLHQRNKKYIDYLNNHIDKLNDYLNTYTLNDSDQCLICYEQLNTTKGVVKLKCNHILCVSCFANHMRQNNNCPFCRFEICDKPKKIINMPDDMICELINNSITRNIETRDGLSMFQYIKKQINNIINLKDQDMLIEDYENQKEKFIMNIFREIKESFQDIIFDAETYYLSFS